MIADTGLIVGNIERIKAFYPAGLDPIGYQLFREYEVTPSCRATGPGFGEPPRADFWLHRGSPALGTTASPFGSSGAPADEFTPRHWP
ncbi:MAG TPA: hypothetical protein VNT76_23490 [Candidatus Binatus sp.]|nr:hypothetical protein [Candidatus Binatus sp.]